MPGSYTVTVPAASTRLSTLANAKLELNITTTTDDAYIGQLLDRASGLIARYCGGPFGVRTVVETFRFNAWSCATRVAPLTLTFWPVTTPGVSSITEDGGAALVEGTDYEVERGAGLIWRLRDGIRWPWYVPPVVVTYQTGYTLPNDTPISGVDLMPPEIESVALALVTAGYTGRGSDPRVQLEQTEGVGRVAYQRTGGIGNMFIDETLADDLTPFRQRLY